MSIARLQTFHRFVLPALALLASACASGKPNPARPVLDPHCSTPRCLTVLSVACADAACTDRPNAAAIASVVNTRFMITTFPSLLVCWIGAKEWAAANATAAEWTVPDRPSETLHHSPTAGISERLGRQVKGLTVNVGVALMPRAARMHV